MNIEKLTTYKERYELDVKKEGIVDKKGRFDYISWSHCEKIGNLLADDFNWRLVEYTDAYALVEMTFKGKTRTHAYPYLNNQNKSIDNPNHFDKNNAQMRGMSKLFSMMTGIGLSLYTGEDLTHLDKEDKPAPKKTTTPKKVKDDNEEPQLRPATQDYSIFKDEISLLDKIKGHKDFVETYKKIQKEFL